jgi:hypothetical protein
LLYKCRALGLFLLTPDLRPEFLFRYGDFKNYVMGTEIESSLIADPDGPFLERGIHIIMKMIIFAFALFTVSALAQGEPAKAAAAQMLPEQLSTEKWFVGAWILRGHTTRLAGGPWGEIHRSLQL